jgi:NAD(P)-dependent dehydrogenase (short-subunit alcohol dehydrogenase family)
VFGGVRRQADAAALQRDSGGSIQPIFLDVTNAQTIAVAAWQVRQQLNGDGLHGLVNNAGIAVGGPLEFLPIAQLRRQLEINVVGQIAVTQAFLSLLRAGTGRVVNMSSVSGLLATPFIGPYSASKFALEALSDALRGELTPWGIRVITIQPGAIATPIWGKSLKAADKIVAELPPEAMRLYGHVLPTLLDTVKKTGERGVAPAKVSRAVAHALTAARPKTHYLVGADARLGAFLAHWLPDRLRHWLILKYGDRF